MSKINELIQTLCPDGVEYKKLGEVATISRGNGFQKKDFVEEGRPCIHYGQIFMHYSKIGIATSETLAYIDNDKYEKNAKALPNDIVMAVTSENVEDVCKCVVWEGDEPVAVSGHTAIFHTEMNSKFLAYWFGSSDFYVQKVRLAHGIKVIEVTPAAMVNIVLPVPPRPVQDEIVRILDEYTDLEAELEAKLSEEIKLKQKQYEVYRDELLTFGDDVEYKKIRDVYTRLRGTPITAGKMKEIADENGDVRIFAGGKTVINAFEKDIPKANITRVPAVLVQSRGVIDFVYYDKPFTFKNEMWAYTHENTMSVQYLCYVLKNNAQTFRNEASGMGSMPQISLSVTEDFEIPVPSPTEQERIVKILDKYDTYTRDMISALNTELESRKKQYAYYRDQLLTFKRKE